MKKVIPLLLSVSMCLQNLHAQKLFQKVDLGKNIGAISGIAQDAQGYIWMTTETEGAMVREQWIIEVRWIESYGLFT